MSTTRPSAVEISLAALALVREQIEEEGKRLFAAGAKAMTEIVLANICRPQPTNVGKCRCLSVMKVL